MPFLVKELAFRSCAAKPRPEADEALRRGFNGSNRARQFIFWAATFVTNAGRLPREFAALLEGDVNELLATRAAPAAVITTT